MEIHIGCSGWFYSHWRGIFYPAREVGTALWFAYYANVFRTVELNAPFYRCMSAASRRALAKAGGMSWASRRFTVSTLPAVCSAS